MALLENNSAPKTGMALPESIESPAPYVHFAWRLEMWAALAAAFYS